MEDANTGVLYGLELQARTLAPQYGEANEVRFLVATNSLKPTNQVHLLEYSEETGIIESKIFEHSLGEAWKLTTCPHDSRLLATCYNPQDGSPMQTHGALLKMPEDLDNLEIKSEFIPWEQMEPLNTENFGEKVKTIEFHPTQQETLACVVDAKVVLLNRSESKTRIVAEMTSSSPKHILPFTTGKWSLHHQGNQFITLHDCSIRSYDIRDTQHCAWAIEEAHGQLVRDLDCNPNKQCHIVTGGDDGYIKVWDYRMSKEPVFTRIDHSHWIWSVRFNTFHDQLILSGSSDCKVMLTCAGSVSSEVGNALLDDDNIVCRPTPTTEGRRRVLCDGLLQTFDQHEDSVYCVEWSNVDPWIFASVSYDGRVIISKVPKQFKYHILI